MNWSQKKDGSLIRFHCCVWFPVGWRLLFSLPWFVASTPGPTNYVIAGQTSCWLMLPLSVNVCTVILCVCYRTEMLLLLRWLKELGAFISSPMTCRWQWLRTMHDVRDNATIGGHPLCHLQRTPSARCFRLSLIASALAGTASIWWIYERSFSTRSVWQIDLLVIFCGLLLLFFLFYAWYVLFYRKGNARRT